MLTPLAPVSSRTSVKSPDRLPSLTNCAPFSASTAELDSIALVPRKSIWPSRPICSVAFAPVPCSAARWSIGNVFLSPADTSFAYWKVCRENVTAWLNALSYAACEPSAPLRTERTRKSLYAASDAASSTRQRLPSNAVKVPA